MATMLIPSRVISESHLQAALSQLIEESQCFDGLERRQQARYPYFRPVTITSDHGERHVSGRIREMTRFSIALLHGGFAHGQTPCSVNLISQYGSWEIVKGVVVDCRHVIGSSGRAMPSWWVMPC